MSKDENELMIIVERYDKTYLCYVYVIVYMEFYDILIVGEYTWIEMIVQD